MRSPTSAHAGLLCDGGLLDPASRLLSRSAIYCDECVEGLVIDDSVCRGRVGFLSILAKKELLEFQVGLFAASRRPKRFTPSRRYLVQTTKTRSTAYSSRQLVQRLIPVFSVSMMGLFLSLRLLQSVLDLPPYASGMRYTSDAFHSSLIGSWVSVLLFRRPAMAVLNNVFKVVSSASIDQDDPRLVKLPRAAADELAVLSALAPVISSNVAVPFSDWVYATDASNSKGTVVKTRISEDVSKLLWRSADKKGENLPFLSKAQIVLKEYDAGFEERLESWKEDEVDLGEDDQSPSRPLGLWYEFIEVCGGAGKISRELDRLGVVVGPVMDLSRSPAYDITDHKVLPWLLHLCENDRLMSFVVAPPCTSFSPAAYPPVRTYAQPRGLLPLTWKALVGNALAFAALCLFEAALRLHVFGLGEQPRRSKMRWLQEWQRLLLLGAREVWLASCAYGSPHKKEIVFIGANMELSSLHRPCPGGHKHIVIQGSYTKPSATYTDELAVAIAVLFKRHIDERKLAAAATDLQVSGLEDQLTNDVCLGADWVTEAAWSWRGASHINLLETFAVLRLFRNRAREVI